MDAPKRVGLYARVSTEYQTIENQLPPMREHCASRGWAIVDQYVDNDLSGARRDRPELERIMEAARKRKIDVLFVWHFDRFARSTSHLASALEELQALGVDFVSLSQQIDTTTPYGKCLFHIGAAFAELERSLIRQRVIAGITRAQKEGVAFGRQAWTKRVGVLSPEQVARVLSLRGQLSVRQIAARVGISKSSVQNVLSTNPPPNVGLSVVEAAAGF